MDLSKISTEDLVALQAGDLTKVSTDTLRAMSLPQVAPKSKPYDPTSGMSSTERGLAGAGKAFVDLGRGAKQAFKEYLTKQPGAAWNGGQMMADQIDTSSIEESRRLDAPLMNTTAGTVGNIGGNVAAMLPAAFVPGANTVVGAGVAGGLMGLLQPTVGDESRGTNAAMGAALGGGSQKVLNSLGQASANRLGKNINAPNENLQAARQAGYVVPPTQADPTIVNRALEGFAGKLTTGQAASTKNQNVTNRLIKQSIGLSDDVPLSADTLQSVRASAGEAYKAIENIPAVNWDKQFFKELNSFKPLRGATTNPADEKVTSLVGMLADKKTWGGGEVVADIKNLREMAKANLNSASRAGGDVEKQTLGKAQRKMADMLEDLVERNLKAQGADETLIQSLREARQTIAKTYDIEKALNPATGNVNAREIGKLLKKDKPVTGEMEQVARFANAYPKASDEILSSMPGLSPLDYAFAGGASAASGPIGMAGLFARPGVRSAILSEPFQNLLNSQGEGAYRLLNNPAVQNMGLLGPSIYASQQ